MSNVCVLEHVVYRTHLLAFTIFYVIF